MSIRADHQLIRTGPYARVRHPIYTGMLLALVGTALVIGEYRALVAFAITLIGFTRKAKKEERFSHANSATRLKSTAAEQDFFCHKCRDGPQVVRQWGQPSRFRGHAPRTRSRRSTRIPP